MSAKEKQDFLNHLKSWGTEDLTATEINRIREIF